MSLREAFGYALGDFYRQSWRLAILNTALSLATIVAVLAALLAWPLVALLAAVGPLAAALMHCAVAVSRGDEIRLRDAYEGLKLHWRRGLVLAALALAVGGVGVLAVTFYAGSGSLGWPLAAVALYIVAVFAVAQLALWPIAISARDQPLAAVAREAGVAVLRRPGGFVALALFLLVVNVLAAAAAIVPFLTLTIAYSFLVAAHFTLPRPTPLEA